MTRTSIVIISISYFLIFFTGFYADQMINSKRSTPEQLEQKEKRESGYKFINPLLECEVLENQGNSKLRDLKNNVENIISQKKNIHISVYYRDLLLGPWYGYNEQENFAPQSLLKLPVVIATLKISEENPQYLQKKVLFEKDYEKNLPDNENLEKGKEYELEELLYRTIVLSDNVAYNLLVESTPPAILAKVHQDLDIPFPGKDTPVNFVSVKAYSSIFRVLYNSSYLSRSNSEYLLSLLNQAEFKEGLVAGVPSDVLISHKFGVRNINDQYKKQLHDCGIIYHPKHPYLLCIMTRGDDGLVLTKTIEEISKAVYQSIDSKN